MATLQAVSAIRVSLDLGVTWSAHCTAHASTTRASVTNFKDTKAPCVQSQAVPGGLRTAAIMARATKPT